MNRPDKFYFLSIVAVIFLFLIAFHLWPNGRFPNHYFNSIILAWGITTVNSLLAFFTIKTGINKSAKVFFRRIFGGMLVRFMMVLLIVVLVLIFLELFRISFIFSILFFYIYYLIVEIIYLNYHQI
jgi:hypothetical protein